VAGDVPPKDRGKSGGRSPARKGLRAATQVEAFLESTSDCVYVVDRDWRFTYLNQRAIAELG
jgi:PAS domain-containing protein